MSFTPMPEPQIAYTDEDIVVRIVTNFISNAVKFTTAGAVQPFVCPLEKIDPSKKNSVHYIELDEKNEETQEAPYQQTRRRTSQDGDEVSCYRRC